MESADFNSTKAFARAMQATVEARYPGRLTAEQNALLEKRIANLAETIGAYLIGLGAIVFFWNLAMSLRNGKPAGDDPWDGNTLEWATSSPPPPYNFDRLPPVRSERPLFDLKHPELARHETYAARGSDR